ncbi:hypothetical protein HX109_10765 [Galbibacter sp. BG1]|uniref:tail fiber protein n=1 Tax=Galbibacter sp. BG1 TaxID=1170699 RepID=UPI0015BF642B|nr:tail fiber protein [Galbibacter sp. BG1]QLE02011.1 hypothetical protein HX109_10765 [Galbibacter sp. BG1]
MNLYSSPKSLLLLVMSLQFFSLLAQKQFNEILSPDTIDTGLYYQAGPGGNNTVDWTYPYGSKITMNAGAYRNFELLTTHYPLGDLLLRQYSPGDSQWSGWRQILVTDENKNLGLGIADPQSKLDVYKEIRISSLTERESTFFRINRGSSGRDTGAISFGQDNNYVWYTGLLYRGGAPNSDFFISQFHQIRDGNGNFVHTPEFTILQNGNIGIGTINPDARLAVKGNIHAQEVKLDLVGAVAPDYVFKDDYKLKSIEEVEQFINREGHLPNVPSAEDLEKDGLDLKQMNLRLLEKIEELTLYVIQLKNENKTQQIAIERLINAYEK